MKITNLILTVLCSFVISIAFSQETESKDPIDGVVKGLKFRSIGPAFTSGRIADIAIHPNDENTWYVAVGSGGIWKTTNAATTWTPIFDDQISYSIGCITIDPSNPHTIWAGTGENVGGRHVGFGDGIYKSTDDGKSWKNMGLKSSEHISKIIVHPTNSDVIWVAAQGPLWSKGGERGLYKSNDGGKTWKRSLGDDEWVGATDLIIDPKNPNVLYAATWQRHRTVASYMGGGPGSAIYRTNDGGETWEKCTNGIPKSNLGKIGITLSPFNSDVVYAAIELDRTEGGVYISHNRGASWSKQSNTVSGATGPHYYQELYASPHTEGKLYLMDNNIQVSDDHGKSFYRMSERPKHSDNHSINFKTDDPDYLLIGTDGGIYESFDHAETWRFIENLPITQYYKVAVDDSEPFYFVYGGTQDNGSHGGPSQTDTEHGIRNADWFKTLFADGHQSATEPGNPNIIYAETQQGGMYRVDRLTGEVVSIQPQAREGESPERFNWDAPIVVSAHNPTRLYFASQRVWKSNDRGDSWTPISGDLSKNQDRMTLPIMGRVQSWDNPWDMKAMSSYNSITSLAESSLDPNIIYAGTDDGLVQVTDNGGISWTKIDLSTIKGIPSAAFVNDIKADLFDRNTVYVSMDNHKNGDFKPYLIKSTDKGKTWQSISSNIPDRHLVFRLVQDHVKKDLLFVATEFGIFCTLNGGNSWTKMTSGLPTIPFRDITIQRRENDLVGASFGRGFYILDDYSPLRSVTETTLNADVHLFDVKEADWFIPRSVVSSQGSAMYAAENPAYGATFSYLIKENKESMADLRKKKEKSLNKEGKDVPFPGWDALEAEKKEEKKKILLTIRDADGQIVQTLEGPASKGLSRVSWNFRYASKNGVTLGRQQRGGGGGGGFFGPSGFMASPGTYSVSMSSIDNGVLTDLGQSKSFQVKAIRSGALPGANPSDLATFRKKIEAFQQDITATSTILNNSIEKADGMQTALSRTSVLSSELTKKVQQLKNELNAINVAMNGGELKEDIGELTASSPRSAMFSGFRALNSSYGPTPLHKETVETGIKQLAQIKSKLSPIISATIPALEKALMDAGAPWIEGQGLIKE